MKHTQSPLWRYLSMALILVTLLAPVSTVFAQDDNPPDLAAQGLPALKAVLVVAPVASDPDWAKREIANMELAAAELAAQGVKVYKFYTPNSNWNDIVAAANGAHFFLYRGDGVAWPTNPQTVGGFYLNDGLRNFYSSDDIRRDLRLAPNAIVMMYACYASGSAGWEANLDSAEAQRRVRQYTDPFFDNGAGAYFADWHGDAFQQFIRMLFQGKTMRQIYEGYYGFDASRVERYSHPDHPSKSIWLDSHILWGGVKYDYAFAGNPDATLQSFFAPVSPSSLTQKVFLPSVRR